MNRAKALAIFSMIILCMYVCMFSRVVLELIAIELQ
jgi:hypothetical protein